MSSPQYYGDSQQLLAHSPPPPVHYQHSLPSPKSSPPIQPTSHFILKSIPFPNAFQEKQMLSYLTMADQKKFYMRTKVSFVYAVVTGVTSVGVILSSDPDHNYPDCPHALMLYYYNIVFSILSWLSFAMLLYKYCVVLKPISKPTRRKDYFFPLILSILTLGSIHTLFLLLGNVFIYRDDFKSCKLNDNTYIIYHSAWAIVLLGYLQLLVYSYSVWKIISSLRVMKKTRILGYYEVTKEGGIAQLKDKKKLAYFTAAQMEEKIHWEECGICKAGYHFDSQVGMVKCGLKHYFHFGCIQQYLQYSSFCPYCNVDMATIQFYDF